MEAASHRRHHALLSSAELPKGGQLWPHFLPWESTSQAMWLLRLLPSPLGPHKRVQGHCPSLVLLFSSVSDPTGQVLPRFRVPTLPVQPNSAIRVPLFPKVGAAGASPGSLSCHSLCPSRVPSPMPRAFSLCRQKPPTLHLSPRTPFPEPWLGLHPLLTDQALLFSAVYSSH